MGVDGKMDYRVDPSQPQKGDDTMAKNESDNAQKYELNDARPISPEEVYANKGLILDVAKRLGFDYNSGLDLVQEVTLTCWKDPRVRFDPLKGTLAGYLYTITWNMAVSMWRKNKHVPYPVEDAELTAMLEREVPESDVAELREKRCVMLERAIKELYRKYPSKEGNDAFVMFAMDGMPAAQVGEKLHREERFVNVAVFRGIKRLTDIVHKMEQEEEWRDAS